MPRYESNESGVMQMMREFLDSGKFADIYKLPQFLHFEQEYSLTRARCDEARLLYATCPRAGMVFETCTFMDELSANAAAIIDKAAQHG